MFTGIITDLGRVRRLRRDTGPEGGCELTIETAYPVEDDRDRNAALGRARAEAHAGRETHR